MFQCMQNMKALGFKTKTFCSGHDDVYTDRRHFETSTLCIPIPFSTSWLYIYIFYKVDIKSEYIRLNDLIHVPSIKHV